MSYTEDFDLPTYDTLTVQEVDVSGPILKAGAVYLGQACLNQNNEFMLCRSETKDPRQCLEEGKAVTNCALNFFRQVKKTCYGEFMQYVNCLDKSSSNQAFEPCRKTQGVYDKCMVDNLGMERPPHDQYARVQVHHAKRARPEPEEKIVYEKVPSLPEDAEKLPAKYGSRYIFMW